MEIEQEVKKETLRGKVSFFAPIFCDGIRWNVTENTRKGVGYAQTKTVRCERMLCGVRSGSVNCHGISAAMDFDVCGIGIDLSRLFPCAQSMRGVLCMKIVVVRSPKLFRGFLRRVFGIKREEYIE